MTKTYQPAATVLPSFTDEALAGSDTVFGPTLVELLLTIPAEYRQAAMAESAARTMDPPITVGGLLMLQPNGVDPAQAKREIVAEIRAQLGL
jgi:hypothetical protein